jgi:DNA repair exonuclease SbcCD ATPase subunit
MQIKKTTLKNFKGLSEKVFRFKEVNLISGKNGSGKTTIKDAIFFCLYNKTPMGSSADTSKYIKNGTDSCMVEVELEIDNISYTIKRERSKKHTVVKLLDGSQSEEDSTITQRELETILPEFTLFQNVFNVRYFMSLPDKKKREFILDNTQEVDKKIIFKSIIKKESDRLIKEYQLDFNDLDKTHKKLLRLKSEEKEQLNENNILLSTLEPIPQEEFDYKKIDKLEKEYDILTRDKDLATKSALEWQSYNEKLIRNEDIEKSNKKIKEKLSKIEVKEVRKPDYRKLDNLLKKKDEIKSVIDIPKGKCPTCLQNINPKHQDKIDKFNDKNIKEAKKIEEEIKVVRADYDKNLKLYLDYKNKINMVESLKNQIREKEEVFNPSKKIVIDSDKERELIDKITQLKIKRNYVEQQKKLEEERIKKVENLKESNKQLIKSIDDLTRLIKVFSPNGIRSEEMRIKLKPVIEIFNQYIPGSEIKTIQILKNEIGYREVFQVYSDGKEYSKMSLGEKTKIDICISKIIDKICGDKIKSYFIDNSEIIDNMPDIRKQTFVAKVNNLPLKIKTIK